MPVWPRVIEVSPKVADALEHRRPVVALESAVVSHGLPRPVGVETAAALERIVRERGATPATLAVIDGKIKAGVPTGELERLSAADAMKVALRDLPVAVAASATGGMTVSACLAVADLLGVRVLSTGGVGGVHLGASTSWDVSADLLALSRYPLAVVCAGAKAVCDIGKTLEYLDTAGVTVAAYRTDRFPHFYALDSGYPAPRRIASPDDAARILAIKRLLGQRTALLLAQPIPAADAIPELVLRDAVAQAVERAAAAGVRGEDVTPYLLAALQEITGGAALRANRALLEANAALAAEVAVAAVRAGEEWISR